MSRPTYEELKDRYNNYQTMHPQEDATSLAIWAMDQIQLDQCYQPSTNNQTSRWFEEWKQKVKEGLIRPSFDEIVARSQEGMIPAANAIDLSGLEWPEGTDHWELMAVSYDKEGTPCYKLNSPYKFYRAKSSWEPKHKDILAFWDNNATNPIFGIFDEYIDGQFRREGGARWQHCAKVASFEDIRKDVDWFKANRPWK